ncbi:MAG: acyl-CoA thioesterase [Chlamydiae bacterium]|nr:acyl-CoA thioesterase [Chlamydiota bacterium]
MIFCHKIKTRYCETAQDGIIHHSSYPLYLEEARIEFFKTLNCSITQLEKEKIFCPVVELSIQYLKPLHALEEIEIKIALSELSKVRFSLAYSLLREEALIAKGITTHCFVNSVFRPIPILPGLLAAFMKKR